MSKFELHAEAACCIWEALLERRTRDDAEPDPIMECFAQRGTSEMRHAAIALAAVCSDTWHALYPDERDVISFDWDFVPIFVDAMIWDVNATFCVNVPNVEQAITLYRAALARQSVAPQQPAQEISR